MKLAVCFLAVVAWAAALPAEFPFDDTEGLELVPNNLYLEPVNPVKSENLPGTRVIGGWEVEPHAHPYAVALVINGLSFCGGSLISPRHVLTAAHCTQIVVFIFVRLGAHAFNSNEPNQVRLTSTSVTNHPNYNQGSFAANDVAIVVLPSNVVLSNHVQVLPLAPANAGSFAGSRAVLTGWGRTSDASNAVSPVLRRVDLNVISNAVCILIFGNDIVATTLCTSGAGTVGACNGDSGGPLTVNGVQVGIVSFGSQQCEAGNPTAFARVSEFRSWITLVSGV